MLLRVTDDRCAQPEARIVVALLKEEQFLSLVAEPFVEPVVLEALVFTYIRRPALMRCWNSCARMAVVSVSTNPMRNLLPFTTPLGSGTIM